MTVESYDKIQAILDTVGQMSTTEALQFKSAVAERFGVTFPQNPDLPSPDVAEVVEEAECRIVLLSITNKLEALKLLRSVFHYTLQEAKEATENFPHEVPGACPRDQAQKIKEAFAGIGAAIELK